MDELSLNTAADKWKEFEEAIMPDNATAIQRREMRKAFYAGMFEALTTSINVGASGSLSDDAAGDYLQSLYDELVDYFKKTIAEQNMENN